MQRQKILVVEGNLIFRRFYNTVLSRAGYEVVTAADGLEGIRFFKTEPINLIITDIDRTVIEDGGFLHSARQQNPVIPVLMILSEDDCQFGNPGLDSDVDEYMIKPVDAEELLVKSGELLRRAGILSAKRICLGNTCLDKDCFTVANQNQTITLPAAEFLLLCRLVSFPGKTFTRKQLADKMLASGILCDSEKVDSCMDELIRCFKYNQDFKLKKVKGLGYKASICEEQNLINI